MLSPANLTCLLHSMCDPPSLIRHSHALFFCCRLFCCHLSCDPVSCCSVPFYSRFYLIASLRSPSMLSHNNLTRPVPPLDPLPAIATISLPSPPSMLSHNDLTRPVPPLDLLPAIATISLPSTPSMLSHNDLTRPVPPLDPLPAIATISLPSPPSMLSHNDLTRPVPPRDALPVLLPSLTPSPFPTLPLSPTSMLLDNDLTGPVPPLDALPAIATISLFHNHFTHNKLTGPVPPLDMLPAIATISLFDNHFTRAPAALLSNENVTLQLYGNDLCVPYRPAATAACSPPLGFMQYQPPPICDDLSCPSLYAPSPPLLALTNACMLYGNDLCVPYRPAVSAACSPPLGFMQYQPPPICDDLSCPSLYAPSPPLLALTNACVCVSPLEVELKLTAPQYAVFNDELASLLVERIAGSLGKNGIGISTGQVG
ncbi:unnamed protein product [Closterium sp. NIES-65]|nr:unnamed protein product [Closterium sp. NIES-65]